MDNYDKNQFKKMKERYTKNLEISDWNELYARMRDDFSVLNDNDLEREKIRTEAIVECAAQYKENIGINYAIPIVTLGFSVIATIITLYIEHLEISVDKALYVAFILAISCRMIMGVVMICAGYCASRRDDIIYYRMKLNIIRSVIEERRSKTKQPPSHHLPTNNKHIRATANISEQQQSQESVHKKQKPSRCEHRLGFSFVSVVVFVTPHGIAIGVTHRREGGESLPAALQVSFPIHTREPSPCVQKVECCFTSRVRINTDNNEYISRMIPNTKKKIRMELISISLIAKAV